MNMKTLEVTAYRIKRLLNDTGWGQAELGRRVGVSQQTVQRWANGKVSPNPENLDKLSEITGCPVYWFMLPPGDDEPVVARGKDVEQSSSLTPDEMEMLQLYRQLPEPEQRNMIAAFDSRLKELDDFVEKYVRKRAKGNE